MSKKNFSVLILVLAVVAVAVYLVPFPWGSSVRMQLKKGSGEGL